MLAEIYASITNELDYAHAKWGTEFDSRNTLNDWAAYVIQYLGDACKMDNDEKLTRSKLIKAAGLLISAILWHDSGLMPKRHYDGTGVTDAKGTRV